MLLEQALDLIYSLPKSTKELLKSKMVEVSLPKGHILFKAGKVESKLYIVQKGIVRAYSYIDDNEITFWFGKEGDVVISMKSYVANQKSYEYVQLLEDCDLYEISLVNLDGLYHEDIHLANWGRKLAELELIKTEARLIERQFGTATNRYEKLLEQSPDILRRVQLGHIASYLGISQVSLSRIRAEIK